MTYISLFTLGDLGIHVTVFSFQHLSSVIPGAFYLPSLKMKVKIEMPL